VLPAKTLIEELRPRYPSFAGLMALHLQRDVRVLSIVAGTRIFEEGTACAGFPLVLEGEIRVARASTDASPATCWGTGVTFTPPIRRSRTNSAPCAR
jgi:CRP/FNR family transcriptional regulator